MKKYYLELLNPKVILGLRQAFRDTLLHEAHSSAEIDAHWILRRANLPSGP